MSSSKSCLKHRLNNIITVFAAWYPPSQTSPTMNEDNPRVMNFMQQRTTKQPNPISLQNLSGGDEDLEELQEEISDLRRKNKRKIIDKLENQDFQEYNESLNVPHNDQSYFGPSYGDPNFLSRSIFTLKNIMKKLSCTCK